MRVCSVCRLRVQSEGVAEGTLVVFVASPYVAASSQSGAAVPSSWNTSAVWIKTKMSWHRMLTAMVLKTTFRNQSSELSSSTMTSRLTVVPPTVGQHSGLVHLRDPGRLQGVGDFRGGGAEGTQTFFLPSDTLSPWDRLANKHIHHHHS